MICKHNSEKVKQSHVTKLSICFVAADADRNDKIACMLEKRQEADVRNLNKALNDFRMMHQQPDGRREWDLYDPDAKRKDKPARVHDDDPRMTISGTYNNQNDHN